jgi:hypothetical protein
MCVYQSLAGDVHNYQRHTAEPPLAVAVADTPAVAVADTPAVAVAGRAAVAGRSAVAVSVSDTDTVTLSGTVSDTVAVADTVAVSDTVAVAVPQLVTCGMGGAFLHPTHGPFPEALGVRGVQYRRRGWWVAGW